MSSVGLDGLRLDLHSTDTLSIDNSEPDVAIVTPAGVPGVLYEPEVLLQLVVITPSDSEHGVVEIGAAFGAVEDTATVRLPDVLVSFDRDCERLLSEGSLHLAHVFRGDEIVLGNVDGSGAALVVFA